MKDDVCRSDDGHKGRGLPLFPYNDSTSGAEYLYPTFSAGSTLQTFSFSARRQPRSSQHRRPPSIDSRT